MFSSQVLAGIQLGVILFNGCVSAQPKFTSPSGEDGTLSLKAGQPFNISWQDDGLDASDVSLGIMSEADQKITWLMTNQPEFSVEAGHTVPHSQKRTTEGQDGPPSLNWLNHTTPDWHNHTRPQLYNITTLNGQDPGIADSSTTHPTTEDPATADLPTTNSITTQQRAYDTAPPNEQEPSTSPQSEHEPASPGWSSPTSPDWNQTAPGWLNHTNPGWQNHTAPKWPKRTMPSHSESGHALPGAPAGNNHTAPESPDRNPNSWYHERSEQSPETIGDWPHHKEPGQHNHTEPHWQLRRETPGQASESVEDWPHHEGPSQHNHTKSHWRERSEISEQASSTEEWHHKEEHHHNHTEPHRQKRSEVPEQITGTEEWHHEETSLYNHTGPHSQKRTIVRHRNHTSSSFTYTLPHEDSMTQDKRALFSFVLVRGTNFDEKIKSPAFHIVKPASSSKRDSEAASEPMPTVILPEYLATPTSQSAQASISLFTEPSTQPTPTPNLFISSSTTNDATVASASTTPFASSAPYQSKAFKITLGIVIPLVVLSMIASTIFVLRRRNSKPLNGLAIRHLSSSPHPPAPHFPPKPAKDVKWGYGYKTLPDVPEVSRAKDLDKRVWGAPPYEEKSRFSMSVYEFA